MASLSLTWIDLVFFVLVGASTLLALFRGLIQEVFAIALWALAFFSAGALAHYAAEWMPETLGGGVRHGLGFGAVFILVLLLGQWVGQVLSVLTQAIGLSWFNRILGAGFGFARGILVCGLLALLGAATSLRTDTAWQQARVRPVLEMTMEFLAPWAPGFLTERLVLVAQYFS